jgi:hypothetical protein
MKEHIISGLVTAVVLVFAALAGMGAWSLYGVVQFQKQYQANIIDAQRQNIEATCAAIAEAKAEEQNVEDESE